jgi:hypothetical protein
MERKGEKIVAAKFSSTLRHDIMDPYMIDTLCDFAPGRMVCSPEPAFFESILV